MKWCTFPSIFLFLLYHCMVSMQSVSTANILLYYGVSAHSHISSFWPVIETLGARGHNLTLLTLLPPKTTHPSVTVILVPELYELNNKFARLESNVLGNRVERRRLIEESAGLGLISCSIILSSPSTQSLLHSTSFDLVIVDTMNNDCAVGLAVLKYKCPFMVNSVVSGILNSHDDFGIPVESSWIPDVQTGKPPVTFFERGLASWYGIKWALFRRLVYFPHLTKLFVEHLHLPSDEEAPDFVQLHKKTSLVLMNNHHGHGYALSLPPLFVSIAGAGILDKRKPLPAALDKFVSSAPAGFIYISFGTVVSFSTVQEEIRTKFFHAFGNMSALRFVWKWEGTPPKDTPQNIYFDAWLPQEDLLAHPKVRGFVTHGGINSINEAVYYGVPMILFPVLIDQDYNSYSQAGKGLGILMEIMDFTQQELQQENLKLILNDEGLKTRLKKASEIFKDRPTKPLDTAVWWIEYVLRHGNTSFLMPGTVHQTWYQRRLLDIWFLLFFTLFVVLGLILYVICTLYMCFCGVLAARVKSFKGASMRKGENTKPTTKKVKTR